MNRRGEIAWSTKRVSAAALALGKLGISGRSAASTRSESTGSGRVERTTTSTDPQSWHCRIGMYISERILLQRHVAHIAHHAHHLPVSIHAIPDNRLAERVLAGPQPPGQRLVDHDDRCRA